MRSVCHPFCVYVDTIGWKPERSADTILNAVLPKLAGGSIILCHNNGCEIENYLLPLIERAQAEGYTFATVPELLLSGETVLDRNGVQQQATGETGAKAGKPAREQTP